MLYQIRKILWLVICIAGLLSPSARAADFWVVGSFENEINAIAEAKRLSSIVGQVFQVLPADELYRVAVQQATSPNTQLVELRDSGLSPWRYSYELHAQNVPGMVAEAESDPTKTQSPTQVVNLAISEPVNSLSPPKAGVDQITYCAKNANSHEREIYCSNDVVTRIGKARALLSGSERAKVLLFCSMNANAQQRREYCEDLQFN